MRMISRWNIGADRSGAAAVEFALIAPVMILLFLASLTVFDIYRTYQNVSEGNAVVADVMSRQTSVDTAFLDNIYGVFKNLQANASAPSAMRISSIKKTAGAFQLAWKKEAGTTAMLPTQALDTSKLPAISDGDSILVVESSVSYALLSTVMGSTTMAHSARAFTRPRFIGAVAYN